MSYYIHIVQAGDTLSALANSYLGDSQRYRTILNGNADPVPNPSLIHVGEILAIPRLDDYSLYQVRRGDTLSALAHAFFGKSNLFNLILDGDGGVIANPDLISVGDWLRLPHDLRVNPAIPPNSVANMRYNDDLTLSDGRMSVADPGLGVTRTTTLRHLVYGAAGGPSSPALYAFPILVDHAEGTTGHFYQLYPVQEDWNDGAIPGDPTLTGSIFGGEIGDRMDVQRLSVRDQIVRVLGRPWPEPYLEEKRFTLFADAMAVGLVPA
ncbi:MAG: LysM peptidoglycan-binding domain-containing protein [Anaerolineales bacterium]|nr:LysM peptidoglycan-binding domain-containing protein [Anaerolineales bacterium]MCB9128511.1 LysM peptidoglycan-binding domain-containing protein [Ardenticatenales bacterium]